ncbi:hypothetical protein [Arenibacter amylolyticus]|nr:hypothetical protein [Arenibacter amylolyticus]
MAARLQGLKNGGGKERLQCYLHGANASEEISDLLNTLLKLF